DFLGLRTLTIIDWAVKAINRRGPGTGDQGPGESENKRDNDPFLPVPGPRSPVPHLDISAIPLDDAKTYELFSRGDTVAVFQFESRGMRELLRRAQPDRFDDLIALVSLF